MRKFLKVSQILGGQTSFDAKNMTLKRKMKQFYMEFLVGESYIITPQLFARWWSGGFKDVSQKWSKIWLLNTLKWDETTKSFVMKKCWVVFFSESARSSGQSHRVWCRSCWSWPYWSICYSCCVDGHWCSSRCYSPRIPSNNYSGKCLVYLEMDS